jgi:hypothetical protein
MFLLLSLIASIRYATICSHEGARIAMKTEWNSLEIAKLSVPIISSLLLALVGLIISQNLANFKSASDRNQA